jgi:sugar lactone lactonase YvrE
MGEGEFTEGPCLGSDGCVHFSDIGNHILEFDPATGKTTVFREPSGRSSGLRFDRHGRLIACEGANTGGKSLYVTAGKSPYRISTTAAGVDPTGPPKP